MHPQDRLFCEIAVQLKLLTREQVQQCLHAQERDPRRNVASIAAQLGFITQPNVEAVMQQQQRVLDRRREARAASRAQREAESRAAAGLRPSPGGGRQSQVESPPRKDPTPTSPWVHDRGAKLRSELPPSPIDDLELAEEHFGEDLDRALASRETLDERPPLRASARSHARDLHGDALQPSAASISGTRDTIEELPRAGWRESQGAVDREDDTRAGRRSPSEDLRLDAARRAGGADTAPADAVSGGRRDSIMGDDTTVPADMAGDAGAFAELLDDAAQAGFRDASAEPGPADAARRSTRACESSRARRSHAREWPARGARCCDSRFGARPGAARGRRSRSRSATGASAHARFGSRRAVAAHGRGRRAPAFARLGAWHSGAARARECRAPTLARLGSRYAVAAATPAYARLRTGHAITARARACARRGVGRPGCGRRASCAARQRSRRPAARARRGVGRPGCGRRASCAARQRSRRPAARARLESRYCRRRARSSRRQGPRTMR